MAKNTRERAEKYQQIKDRRPHASASYLCISPSKVRIVLDLVRGKSYNDAVVILSNTNKAACPLILKVMNSAAANAENNLNMPKDTLFVAECWVGPGPTLKRLMPRAKGRADRILKRTSHINVILDEKKDAIATPKPKAKKETAVKKETAKAATPEKKPTASKKEAPATKTVAEKPLAKEPNSKKPLGTKKEATPKAAPKKENA